MRSAGKTDNNSRACMDFGGWFNVKETTASGFYRREGEEPRDSRLTMEGERRSQRGVTFLLVMLFVFSLFPGVQAQAGEVLLEEASFSIVDYASFEGENLSFTVEIHEQSGGSSNATLFLLVETLEGTLLSNSSLGLNEFLALEQRNVSGAFVGLPFGFSTVSLVLDGDVGSNTTTHQSILTRTVQRLRPLAITLGGASSVLANPVDAVGQSTGNTTLHDGDRVEVAFPIINNGDVNWTGAVELHLTNNGLNETVVLDNLSIEGSTSQAITFTPTMVLTEGVLGWNISLTNTTMSEEGTHYLDGSWDVGPPPLPVLDGFIESNADEVQAGGTLTISVSMWNNGSVSFEGSIFCSADGDEVFNTSSLLLEAGSNSTWSFTLSAKPFVIQCDASDARVSEASSTPLQLDIEMPSAVFQSAGATTPSYSGGPWHKGDSVEANMLLRNIGELDGRVRLVLSTSTSTSEGEWVEMAQGAAGEISASLQFLASGETTLTWTLESDDGVFDGIDNGSTSFVIKQQQSVQIAFVDVNRTEDAELSMTLHLDLDEGKERDVRLQVGYESGGSTVFLQENDLRLQQGRLELTFLFGDFEADKLVAQVAPLDWLIGPGPLAATSSLPSDDTQFWMDFSATTDPIRPIEGEETTVRLTFQQTGPLQEAEGEVWLMDAYGTRLAKVTSPDWDGASAATLDVVVVWPKGSSVAIQALWYVDGAVLSAETTYVSGEVVIESSGEWPIGAMFWGLALGAGVALLLRIRARKEEESDTNPSGKSTMEKAASKPLSTSQEKREVSCPECNRRLRVPVDYGGSVGCPDCAHKFKVEPERSEEPAQEQNDDLEIEVQPVSKAPVSEKIEISCPDCAQTLRIPSSYEGSVRCPACTKIFKAHESKQAS